MIESEDKNLNITEFINHNIFESKFSVNLLAFTYLKHKFR